MTDAFVAGIVAEGRGAARQLLVDTCTIRRPGTGAPVLDENTLELVPAGTTVVYQGPCRLRQRAIIATGGTEVAETEVSLQSRLLEVPWDAPSPEINDVATLDVSDDSHAVGRPFRVTQVHHSSTLLMRRLTVEDVDAA